MSRKKPKKRPVRGSPGSAVTLPTEPIAGASKDTPIMAVLVQAEGKNPLLEYEYQARRLHRSSVSAGKTGAFIERIVGPAPDGDIIHGRGPRKRRGQVDGRI